METINYFIKFLSLINSDSSSLAIN